MELKKQAGKFRFALRGVLFAAIAPLLALQLAGAATEQPAEISLVSPPEGAAVSQLNAAQKEFLAMPRKERIEFFADSEKRANLARNAGFHPQPIEFAWRWNGHDRAEYQLHVSMADDFSKALVVNSRDCKASVDNLRINTRYYWKVTAHAPDGRNAESAVGVFKTADETPRLMRIDNVPNVRDLGGRKAMGGKRVRQDLVFRTAGLNDNAKTVYEDEEVVLASDNGKLRKERDKILLHIEHLKEQLSNAKEIEYLPFLLKPEWTTFRPAKEKLTPDDIELIARQTMTPENLLGAKAEKAALDQEGCFAFEKPLVFTADGKPNAYAPAVFMQEFDSPADGVMQIGCGADWFWDFRINGTKVFDAMLGNNKSPVAASNFVFDIPVRKGKNIACVVLLSGAASWTWCCAEQPRVPIEKVLGEQIARAEQDIKAMLKVVKGREPGKNRLNDEMKQYMLVTLGIRTDIDLRRDDECFAMIGSPLGDTVNWVHVSSRSYQYMQDYNGKEAFATVFRVFCDEKNYPIIFHCIAGQDRTGAVAFILNGLLGVDEEELYKDWEASGFWNKSADFSHAKRFNKLIEAFQQNYPQPTWREKLEAYIRDAGITQDELDKFRAIMLEDDNQPE